MQGLRPSLLAIDIGLVPQVFFLMELNTPLGPFHGEAAAGWLGFIEWYEPKISCLQDRVGDYLMPHFLVGTGVAILMFLIVRGAGNRFVTKGWDALKTAMRFVGLALVTATSFAVATGAPVGQWEPDARQVAKFRLAEVTQAKTRLRLYEAIRTALQTDQAFVAQLASVSSLLGPINPLYRDEAAARLAPDKSSSLDPALYAQPWKMDRVTARHIVDKMAVERQAADEATERLREEVAGICASAIGSSAEHVSNAANEMRERIHADKMGGSEREMERNRLQSRTRARR